MQENKIFNLYKTLLKNYKPQGWWPTIDGGYHPNDYRFDKSDDEIFEICLGVILTQNTSFESVVKSMQNLSKLCKISPKNIENLDIEKLRLAIKPSGYYNQKTSYILNFIDFFNSLDGREPTRDELLGVKGIGNESADSILLYGYNQSEFVVDTYTKRVFLANSIINEDAKYMQIKNMVEQSFQKELDTKEDLTIAYNEFHALIVAHAKEFHSRRR